MRRLVAAVAVLLVAGPAACGDDDEPETVQDVPEIQLGDEVTVDGQVVSVLSDDAFRLEVVDEQGFDFELDPAVGVLVVAAGTAVAPGDELRVEGRVRELDLAEVASEADVELDAALEQELVEEGEVVIVAGSVEPLADAG